MVRRSVDRSVGIFIGIRLVIGVVVAVESGEDGEVGLEVGGWVGSRYERIVGKIVKGGVNVITDDSVGWGVYIGVGVSFCTGVGGEVNMSKAYYVWSFWHCILRCLQWCCWWVWYRHWFESRKFLWL